MPYRVALLLSLACVLPLLIGCGRREVRTERPAVILGETDLGLPVFAGAMQIRGERGETKVEAVFETKEPFADVERFYRERTGSWISLDKVERGGLARIASGGAVRNGESFALRLEQKPAGYVHIRLTRSRTEAASAY